jgi:hypothetical protein
MDQLMSTGGHKEGIEEKRCVDARKGSSSARIDRRPGAAFTRRAVVVDRKAMGMRASMVEGRPVDIKGKGTSEIG